MKITRRQLQRLIKEELAQVLQEQPYAPPPIANPGLYRDLAQHFTGPELRAMGADRWRQIPAAFRGMSMDAIRTEMAHTFPRQVVRQGTRGALGRLGQLGGRAFRGLGRVATNPLSLAAQAAYGTWRGGRLLDRDVYGGSLDPDAGPENEQGFLEPFTPSDNPEGYQSTLYDVSDAQDPKTGAPRVEADDPDYREGSQRGTRFTATGTQTGAGMADEPARQRIAAKRRSQRQANLDAANVGGSVDETALDMAWALRNRDRSGAPTGFGGAQAMDESLINNIAKSVLAELIKQ